MKSIGFRSWQEEARLQIICFVSGEVYESCLDKNCCEDVQNQNLIREEPKKCWEEINVRDELAVRQRSVA